MTTNNEPRNTAVSISCTESERAALQLLVHVQADKYPGGVSQLLRSRNFATAVKEGTELRERLTNDE